MSQPTGVTWNCPICGQTVFAGLNHICWEVPYRAATIQYVYIPPPDYTDLLTRIAVAQETLSDSSRRIAAALGRIAEALEKGAGG